MHATSYTARRGEIETYFDRTAMAAWARLTSDAPVGRIRATVRAGRDAMRDTLLSWLPADMRGMRLLDAGCGTGALALAAAARGAAVVAVDLSPQLIALAQERAKDNDSEASSRGVKRHGDPELCPKAGLPRFARNDGMGLRPNIRFLSGDMLDPDLGRFDYVVAMDSLIHYRRADVVAALSALAPRVNNAILFTFAPRTPMLMAMHSVGQLFPKGDRSPAIEPQREAALRAGLAAAPGLTGFHAVRAARIATGFYVSQALELRR